MDLERALERAGIVIGQPWANHSKTAGTVQLSTLKSFLAVLARSGTVGSLASRRVGQVTGILRLVTCIVHGINLTNTLETSSQAWEPSGLVGKRALHIAGTATGTPCGLTCIVTGTKT
jgi:hypothetical protein